MFRIQEVDPAIHETKAIRRANDGVRLVFEDVAARYMHFGRVGKSLLPSLDYASVDIPKMNRRHGHVRICMTKGESGAIWQRSTSRLLARSG